MGIVKVPLSAMILTGGASSRFGSDKSQARLGALSLIENLLNTIPSEIDVIIVGPELPFSPRPVRYTLEEPPGGGPVAAIAAGVKVIETEFVAVIATDMPFAYQILTSLLGHYPEREDATIPLDSTGLRQPLCALYRTLALKKALGQLGDTQGQSVRNLIAHLRVKDLELDSALRRILIDVDTPSDLERANTLREELEQ